MNDNLQQSTIMTMVPENIAGLQQELLTVIHGCHSKGWAQATSTNFSFRNPASAGETYTISKSGVDKGLFSVNDFMVIDSHGKAGEDYRQFKPSAETLLHTMLYSKLRCNAVLHTHSVAATVLSRRYRQQKEVSISGLEILKGLKGVTTHETTVTIPVFDNSQDMTALSELIGNANPASMYGFLLAGHGLYTWGETIPEAKRHLETLEFLFECVNALDLYIHD